MRVVWSLNLVRFCGSNILKSTGLTCNQINYIRRVTIHAIIDWILLVVISTFKPVPYNHIITNFTFPPSTLFFFLPRSWPLTPGFSFILACRRSAGRPAIKGGSGFTLLLLQYEHRCRIFLTAVRQRRIQYCRLSSFRTCPTPSCLSFSWQSITMRRLSSLSGDNTMGCRLENGICALSIRPPTRTISSPSRKGEREASLSLSLSCWETFHLGAANPELLSTLQLLH